MRILPGKKVSAIPHLLSILQENFGLYWLAGWIFANRNLVFGGGLGTVLAS
jgi:hypothetical protein